MATGLADIRTAFLDHFARLDHRVVPSAPLVPLNDPTLLFTNAGMVPFKNCFTGHDAPPAPRAASAQKCVRAGGKHNDLDNVGYTARHHTFFEMLGNFSFGDYFKEEAISYAWDFLTHTLALPPEKLVITVYAEDEEAHTLWRKIAGLSDERIIRIATDDNFWAMGETGPCGPCSEIFYDHGESVAGGLPGSPDEDGDRFVEIWNLVFMQFERHEDGTRTDLPAPCIDTGMGLERMAAALQGHHDNYATDLMTHLIDASASLSNTPPDGEGRVSHRIIADHLRASAFLIADGVLPSNEGRGYVLRRIMRRAMRHAQLLGATEPFLWRLVPALRGQMAAAYPELDRADALIVETLRHEESRFHAALSRGLRMLEDEIAKLDGDELSGETAFKLYDTYGLLPDLTQDVLRTHDKRVDMDGFDAAMAAQREAARANWSGSGDGAVDEIWFDLHNKHGATEFVGYGATEAEGVITALVADGQPVEAVEKGDTFALLVNQTPFYGESGGQVGDTGTLEGTDFAAAITDTQKMLDDMHILHGKVRKGRLAVGDAVHQRVDADRRTAIRANHSATHLLHEALRRVLGAHVTQKGSRVDAAHLRFDFSHGAAMTPEEIAEAETLVNRIIRDNEEVATRLMTPDEAVEAGALALFGEKYGDEVRVLSMGGAPDGDAHYSVELCGGTHVARLGDIGLMKIVSESAVAAGVRRIEAYTGAPALAHIAAQEAAMHEAAGLLKVKPQDLPDRVARLLDERKRFERDLKQAKQKLAMRGGGDTEAGDAAREINGVGLLARIIEAMPARELRALVDEGKKRLGSGVVAFVGIDGDKAGLAVGVTDDLTARFDAVALARAGAEKLGGTGGGGRPDMAQAGGSDINGGAAALAAIEALIAAETEG